MRPRQTLVIMLKAPRVGQVKTRLGKDIGMVDATWWFRHQTRRLIRRLDRPTWTTILAIAPDHLVLTRAYPAHVRRVPQGHRNLGDRMRRVLHRFRSNATLIIGGDVPGITPRHIEHAFQALKSRDAVFGPAEDGGYWLIGLRPGPVPPPLFTHVRWSTEFALEDTVATLPGRRIGYLERLRDVDTARDL